MATPDKATETTFTSLDDGTPCPSSVTLIDQFDLLQNIAVSLKPVFDAMVTDGGTFPNEVLLSFTTPTGTFSQSLTISGVPVSTGTGVVDHGGLTGLSDDDHPQYSLVDGTRAFTGTVGGITPVATTDLTTKAYVDGAIVTATGEVTLQEAYDNGDGRILVSDNTSKPVVVSGTFVVSGTSSQLSRVNSTAVTNTVPVRGGVGSATAPTYSFTAGTNTGMYRSAAGVLSFTTEGVARQHISSSQAQFTVPVRPGAGVATAPTHSFSGDTNTGIYRPALDQLAVTASGREVARFGHNIFHLRRPIVSGTFQQSLTVSGLPVLVVGSEGAAVPDFNEVYDASTFPLEIDNGKPMLIDGSAVTPTADTLTLLGSTTITAPAGGHINLNTEDMTVDASNDVTIESDGTVTITGTVRIYGQDVVWSGTEFSNSTGTVNTGILTVSGEDSVHINSPLIHLEGPAIELVEGYVLFSGTQGITPAAGAGTRFMWIPSKASIRAGMVDGDQWDDANIGVGSIAFGENNEASGADSFAMGANNEASGANSIAFGDTNTESGPSSVSIGTTNVGGGGTSNITIGTLNENSTSAFSNNNFIVGYGNDLTTATVTNSVLGLLNTVGTFASQHSIVGANNSVTGGSQSVSVGANTISSANFAAAVGSNNTVSANSAVCVGVSSSASGFQSVTVGTTSDNSGLRSFALGRFVNQTHNDAFVIGTGFSANSRLASQGNNTLVIGNRSTVPAVFVDNPGGANTYPGVAIRAASVGEFGEDISLAGNTAISGTLTTSGSLGVGIIPSSTLHVNGNTTLLGSLTIDGDGDATSGQATVIDSSFSQLKIEKASPAGQNATIDFNPEPADGSSNATVRMFRETNTTGQVRVQFNRGDNSAAVDNQIGSNGATTYFSSQGDSRIGIGTTSPDEILHVVGSGIFDMELGSVDTEGKFGAEVVMDVDDSDDFVENEYRLGGKTLWYTGVGGVAAGGSGGVNNAYFLYDNTTNKYVITVASGTTTGTDNANSLSIDGDGKVGLGTFSPTHDLHVVGSGIVEGDEGYLSFESTTGVFSPQVTIDATADVSANLVLDSGDTTAQNAQIVLRDRGTDQWALIKRTDNIFAIVDSPTSFSRPFQIEHGASTNTFVIDSESRIGINTASPTHDLHVVGSGIFTTDLDVTQDITASSGTFTTGLTVGTASTDIYDSGITAASGTFTKSLTVSGVPVDIEPDTLEIDNSTLSISNTTSETTLYSFTVPGGTMGPNSTLRFEITGDFLKTPASSHSLTLRIKFGGTTLFADTHTSIGPETNVAPVIINIDLNNKDSLSSQFIHGDFTIGNRQTAPTTGIGTITASSFIDATIASALGSSSADTTSDQTFEVTVQFNLADSNYRIRRLASHVEHLKG